MYSNLQHEYYVQTYNKVWKFIPRGLHPKRVKNVQWRFCPRWDFSLEGFCLSYSLIGMAVWKTGILNTTDIVDLICCCGMSDLVFCKLLKRSMFMIITLRSMEAAARHN